MGLTICARDNKSQAGGVNGNCLSLGLDMLYTNSSYVGVMGIE